jgi:hypothetical protein
LAGAFLTGVSIFPVAVETPTSLIVTSQDKYYFDYLHPGKAIQVLLFLNNLGDLQLLCRRLPCSLLYFALCDLILDCRVKLLAKY